MSGQAQLMLGADALEGFSRPVLKSFTRKLKARLSLSLQLLSLQSLHHQKRHAANEGKLMDAAVLEDKGHTSEEKNASACLSSVRPLTSMPVRPVGSMKPKERERELPESF